MLTNKRFQLKTAITFILLLVITPVPIGEAATGEHPSNHSPQATHSFWLSPLTSQVYSFECAIGDALEGSFTVTTDGDHFIYDQKKYDLWVGWGDGVDLYIFDNQSFEAWAQGLSATPLYSEKDLTELSWRISIPREGYWYVVYDNDSSIYGKQVEGTITQLNQNSTVILGLIILSLGAVVSLIFVSLYRKR